MWHHGVDLYGYQDRAMKKSFDAALGPAGNGEASNLLDAYPYAFRHYQDPRYLQIISKLRPGFVLAIGERLPSLPDASAAVAGQSRELRR